MKNVGEGHGKSTGKKSREEATAVNPARGGDLNSSSSGLLLRSASYTAESFQGTQVGDILVWLVLRSFLLATISSRIRLSRNSF